MKKNVHSDLSHRYIFPMLMKEKKIFTIFREFEEKEIWMAIAHILIKNLIFRIVNREVQIQACGCVSINTIALMKDWVLPTPEQLTQENQRVNIQKWWVYCWGYSSLITRVS